MKKNKICVCILMVALLISSVFPLTAAAQTEINPGKVYKDVLTYESGNASEKRIFDEVIHLGAKKYKLDDIQYEIIKKEPKKIEKEVKFFESTDPVPEGKKDFAKTIEKDGIIYELYQITDKEAETYEQEVSAYTDYTQQVTEASVPPTKTVTVKNEKTGKQEEIVCMLESLIQNGNVWKDSYVDVQFQGMDGNVFHWMDVEIPNIETTAPLKGYDAQILASVGLNGSNAKVTGTYWTSQEYIGQDGVLCRDARADIQVLEATYRANYVGEIVTPMVISEAEYRGTKTVESDTDMIYTIQAIATYRLDYTMLYAGVGIGIIILILLVVGILYRLSIKKSKKGKGEK